MTAPTWLDDEDDDLAPAGDRAGAPLRWWESVLVVLGVTAILAAVLAAGGAPVFDVLRWLLEGR